MITLVNAQNSSKKELQLKKQEILSNLKELVAKGQLDSVLNYLRSQTNVTDTSLQVYQSTNQKGGVLEMVVLDGDTLYVYNSAIGD